MREPEIYRQAYRDLSKRFHPDAGGAPAEWAKLQQANDVLKRHHGL